MTSKLQIKLESYDPNLLDRTLEKIINATKHTGVMIGGPMPLPTKIKKYTILRAPHIDKKSREQFEERKYKRLMEIYASSSKTIDRLMKLEISSGIEVKIKYK